MHPSRHSGRPPPTRVSYLLPSPAARRMHGDERRPGDSVIDCGSRPHPASGPLVAIVRPGMEHARLRETTRREAEGGAAGCPSRVSHLTGPPIAPLRIAARRGDGSERPWRSPVPTTLPCPSTSGVATIGTSGRSTIHGRETATPAIRRWRTEPPTRERATRQLRRATRTQGQTRAAKDSPRPWVRLEARSRPPSTPIRPHPHATGTRPWPPQRRPGPRPSRLPQLRQGNLP